MAIDRKMRFITIGKCLDRFEEDLFKHKALATLTEFRKNRFDRFIDVDVSKVDVEKLIVSADKDFVHDMVGIFTNLRRNGEKPEASVLDGFVPRAGLVS